MKTYNSIDMQQRTSLLVLCSFFMAACDMKSKPYLKHEMDFEKIAGDCAGQETKMSIDANTIGDRYVFQECLDAAYDGAYTVQRNGDTVSVKLAKGSAATALYRITLDINTRPAYSFLEVNGSVVPVLVQRP